MPLWLAAAEAARPAPRVNRILSTHLDGQSLLTASVAAAMVLGVGLLLYRTRWGIALRAVADNRVVAGMMGIDIRTTLPFAFALTAMLGSVAGCLVAPVFFAQFRMGQVILVKAFAAAVIGGLESIPGVFAGGVFLGVMESIVGGYVSSTYKDFFAFALLITVLVLRPMGILGGRRVEKD